MKKKPHLFKLARKCNYSLLKNKKKTIDLNNNNNKMLN